MSRLVSLVFALNAACSAGGSDPDAGSPADGAPDVDTDSDSDVDSDGDSDTELVPGECPTALVPTCGDALYELPLLLDADSIAEGLRFVDLTEDVIAGEREQLGDVEIVTARRCGEGSTWFWWHDEPLVASLALSSGHLVAVAPAGGEDPSEMTALLVCQDSGACAVFLEFEFWDEGTNQRDSAIEPFPRWVLPESLAARRIRPTEGDGAVIAVGDGAVALEWDGSLTELIPSGDGALLNDAADAWLFVGEGGRVVRRDPLTFAVEELDAGTGADLLSVADGFEVAAGDGALGHREPDLDSSFTWTQLASEPLVEVHAGYERLVLTASGCVIDIGGAEPCVGGVVPEPAARAVTWRCEDSTNTDVLAPGGLYGHVECYDIR